jgi:hypothetical protein
VIIRDGTVNPKTDRFPADKHTPLRQSAFNVGRDQGEAMIRPNSMSNDLTWISKALQARHIGGNSQGGP